MPRNGSGQYNPLTNTWNPPVTGVLATGADFQAQLNDISAAITQSVSKDGQTPMTANLPMGNNSIVGIASGTETSPSISANGDTNTGLYFPAADTVAIATGGVKRVEVDANGNVGVGVTPSSNWATSGKKVIQLGSGGVLYGDNALAQQVTLGSNWTYDGTTQKYLTTAAAAGYQQNFGGHSWFTAPSGTAGNPITFTQAMTLDASGNLLVGTTSPFAALAVNRAQGGASTIIGVQNDGTVGASTKSGFGFYDGGVLRAALIRTRDGGASPISLETYDTVSLVFGTNNTERARIDTSGNLLVNRTSRLNSGKIEALASTSEQAFVAQVQTNTNSLFQGFNASGSSTFYVIGSGGIYSTSTTITAISDVSQKENIRPIEYGIAEVCALNPVKFDFKEGCGSEEKDLLGFVAQDVEPVIPELVKPFGDDGLKGLKTGDMIPVLVKAIQEQQALIEAQKTAIESLTARIAALEAK